MAKRMCSCCNEIYTDESGHDLEECTLICKLRLKRSVKELLDAQNNLAHSYQRQIAQLKEDKRCLTDY